ncbi:MAG: ATP-dependent helicase [Bacillaceae bacterium]|nr:ATP-dependent helicase [Bacillaceae bacterium]
MTISETQLIKGIEEKNGHEFNDEQEKAIKYGNGPLWLVAGPGTGKSEVLVVRTLKLVCCDNVDPQSIILTTFTEKAARNLEERILESFLFLKNRYQELNDKDIDISQLRLGTLHSIMNDILQEQRFEIYQNTRLMDEIEAKMLIRSELASDIKNSQQHFQQEFQYLFGNFDNPNLWEWTRQLNKVFSFIVDHNIDLDNLKKEGGAWEELVTFYEKYEDLLNNRYSCDFSQLQKIFLNFLQSTQGELFLRGNIETGQPPITHVLVDEYQDTNPIQEEIYFQLTKYAPHNLTVVGDDDQALYRFRGGTVECMVNFGKRCELEWGLDIEPIFLNKNYRSDKKIIDWCNSYITSFDIMNQPNARISGKPELESGTDRDGNYKAVGYIKESSVAKLAKTFAETVHGLVENGIVEDYSQCVLLLHSTKNKPRIAGPYINALNQYNIPYYNPRSKAFLDQIEVKEFLGTLISILDPSLVITSSILGSKIVNMVEEWITFYESIKSQHQELKNYVEKSIEEINSLGTNERLTPNAQSILYRILSLSPFNEYQGNPEQDLRLSKVTRLFEAFSSQIGYRSLFTDKEVPGQVSRKWLEKFYYVFCGYLQTHGMDDDEDEEVICPKGMLPIMTIHQAKGLEFDFVFVGSLGKKPKIGGSHYLEHSLASFHSDTPVLDPEEAAWQDSIRLHYVAYSRAKYALIPLVTSSQLRNSGNQTASFGQLGGRWFRSNLKRL